MNEHDTPHDDTVVVLVPPTPQKFPTICADGQLDYGQEAYAVCLRTYRVTPLGPVRCIKRAGISDVVPFLSLDELPDVRRHVYRYRDNAEAFLRDFLARQADQLGKDAARVQQALRELPPEPVLPSQPRTSALL